MKKICIYGKGGIGKSTTVSNVAAAMAEEGLRVAVVGCDPKADTTRCLMGRKIPSVLELMSSSGAAEVAFTGYCGILCMESGGPEPGTGCAGRGDVYLVTTADFMSIYAANNICRGIARYAQENEIRLAGILYNARSGRDDTTLVERFARTIGTSVAGYLPMSEYISRAELERRTVVEAFPESDAARCFRKIAHEMLQERTRCIPVPMTEEEVESLCRR